MKHWELAPTNLAALEKNGINFAITASGLKKAADFLPNLRKAIENGLSETTALKALTITPAQLLKVEDQVGSLKKGMLANFIVTSGKLFDEKTVIHQNWIQGEPYSVKSLDTKNFNASLISRLSAGAFGHFHAALVVPRMETVTRRRIPLGTPNCFESCRRQLSI